MAINALQELSEKYAFGIEIRDILAEKQINDEYWIRIPVLKIDGKDVFEAKDIKSPGEIRAQLQALVSSMI